MSFGSLEQIYTDWNTTPIVDLQVLNNTKCAIGWVNLFTSKWQGTIKGCQVDGEIMTVGTYTNKYGQKDRKHKCEVIPAVEEIEMRNPFDKVLCGKYGGLPFVNVTRVNNETGLCP